ncbi:Beta-1,4-glucuronyltransferase 1, variant 2 [Balamuthia mandrillaris]
MRGRTPANSRGGRQRRWRWRKHLLNLWVLMACGGLLFLWRAGGPPSSLHDDHRATSLPLATSSPQKQEVVEVGVEVAKKREVWVIPPSCPYFSDIQSFSFRVHWLEFTPEAEQYEQMVQTIPSTRSYELHLQLFPEPQFQTVYEGTATSFLVEGLRPNSRYNLTIVATESGLPGPPLALQQQQQPSSSLPPSSTFVYRSSPTCFNYVFTMGSSGSNLLRNPSFEHLGPLLIPHPFDASYQRLVEFPAHWNSMMSPIQACKDKSHSGLRSLCFHVLDKRTYKYAAQQYVYVNQSKPYPLLISGWSASRGVSGSTHGGYSVTAELKYVDGSYSYGHSLNWNVGTNDWTYQCMLIQASKAIEAVSLIVSFQEHFGSVWFDEVSLRNLVFLGEEDTEQCVQQIVEQTSTPGCCPRRQTLLSPQQPDSVGVTIATQLTVDRLQSLKRIIDHWDGMISAAIYVLSEEEETEVISFRDAAERHIQQVDYHLVYSDKSYTFRTLGMYPINTLRNVAMLGCRTRYSLTMDVDFVPSPEAYHRILYSF